MILQSVKISSIEVQSYVGICDVSTAEIASVDGKEQVRGPLGAHEHTSLQDRLRVTVG